MIIWDGVCSDDSKHSWTRQSITRICFWCGGKATSSGVGVYSGLSIIRCRVHGRSKCWDWVLCNRDSCVLQSVSSEAFVGTILGGIWYAPSVTIWTKKSHTFEDVAMKYWKYASLQDYMKESDNLVSLHAKIRECDTILTHMESLLGGFQVRWRCNQ